MSIHNYNSLTRETDRGQYKGSLDDCFGHGSAKTILEKRKSMLYSAQSLIDLDHITYEPVVAILKRSIDELGLGQ